jgi:integrase
MRTIPFFSSHYGITEIRHSLKTQNKKTAQKLAIHIYHRLDIIFAKFIKKDFPMQDFDKIKQLINTYIKEAIKEYSELENLRHKALRFTDDDGKTYNGHTPKAIDRERDILYDLIMEYDPIKLKSKAEEILPRTNIPKDEVKALTKIEKEIFYPELLKGEDEILYFDKNRNEQRVTGGELRKAEEHWSNFVPPETFANAVQAYSETNFHTESVKEKSVNLLSKLSPNYLENESEARAWREKTYHKIVHALKLLLEIIGDKSVEKYTRKDFEEFRKILQKLPSNAGKKKEFEGKTLIEIAEENSISKQHKVLTSSSVNTLIGQVHAFFEWCLTHGYIQNNFCKKLKVRDRRKKSTLKDIFNNTNLFEIKTKIFCNVQKLYDKNPERVWIPMIGFYQGMRLEEIAQLHLEDIYQNESDMWVFDLNENTNQNNQSVKKIKNNPSVRIVPIHPKLIEFGFLNYYEMVKKAGHERVFYNLKDGRDGFGRGVGDWFNTQTKRHISNSEKKSFHSTRHTFMQLLKNLDVDEHKLTGLVGHGEEKIAYDRYGNEFTPEILFPELIKVEYPQFEELFNEWKR